MFTVLWSKEGACLIGVISLVLLYSSMAKQEIVVAVRRVKGMAREKAMTSPRSDPSLPVVPHTAVQTVWVI